MRPAQLRGAGHEGDSRRRSRRMAPATAVDEITTRMLEDVVVLWFDADVPHDLSPPAVGDPLRVKRVRCHGWPEGAHMGTYAWGRPSGPLKKYWVEVHAEGAAGYPIQTGFSGSPAFADLRNVIVGMVVAADRNPALSYIVPRSSSEPPKLEALEPPTASASPTHRALQGIADVPGTRCPQLLRPRNIHRGAGQAHRHAPSDARRRRLRQRQVVGGFRGADLEAEPRRRLGYRRLSARRDAAKRADARTGDVAGFR